MAEEHKSGYQEKQVQLAESDQDLPVKYCSAWEFCFADINKAAAIVFK